MTTSDEQWCVALSVIEHGDLEGALRAVVGGALPAWVEDELRIISEFGGKLTPREPLSHDDDRLKIAWSDYRVFKEPGEKAGDRLTRVAASNSVKRQSLKNLVDGRGRLAGWFRRLRHLI